MKEKQNRVHIIVPVYNTPEKLFRDCLRSIREQEHINFTCIVVDDGSAPETAALCDEAVARDSRFTVVRKKNEGLAYARRDGTLAALADGAEYISFIDSDDSVDHRYMSMMFGKLLETNSDACFCGLNLVCDGKTTVSDWSPSESGTSEDQHGILMSVLDLPHKNFGTRFIVWAGIYRASLFDGVDWEFTNVKIRVGDDTRMSWQLMLKVQKVAYLQDGLYNYIQHQSNMTLSMGALERLEQITENKYAMIEFAKQRVPGFDEHDFTEYSAFGEVRTFSGFLGHLLNSGVNGRIRRDEAVRCVRHIRRAMKTPGASSWVSRFPRNQRIGLFVLNRMGLHAYRLYRSLLKGYQSIRDGLLC